MAVILEEHKEEKVTFLGSRVIVKSSKESSSCCFGWSKTRIFSITCLAVFLGMLAGGLVFYLAVYQFNSLDKSGDFEKWEEELSGVGQTRGVSMSGVFTLQSYDDQYEPYLKALGIPWYVVPLILAASEKLTIKVSGQQASIETETSLNTHQMSFTFGEAFNVTYGKGMGNMLNICTREAPNVMICKSEEKEKGWNLMSKLTFTEMGIINQREFVDGDMAAKKFYKREGSQSKEKLKTIGDKERSRGSEEEEW